MPKHYPYRNGNVQGVLCSVLGYFKRKIGLVHHVLADPVYFIAENKGVFLSLFGPELVKLHRIKGLHYEIGRASCRERV